jgi:hypothetical protein
MIDEFISHLIAPPGDRPFCMTRHVHEELVLSPGDRVVLIATGECGVVVHTAPNETCVDLLDCHVAFFGDAFPSAGERLVRPPYVLRYASSSLRRVRPEPQ